MYVLCLVTWGSLLSGVHCQKALACDGLLPCTCFTKLLVLTVLNSACTSVYFMFIRVLIIIPVFCCLQVLRNSEASHQTAFLAIYNMETTEILGFHQVILLTVARNVVLFG